MNTVSDIDFLIVGQGLAGSAVAMRAVARHHRIMVFDDPSQNHSSVVAAGLFNPVTGRKMTKTWLADEIFHELHRYYTEAERVTNKKFFFPMPLFRPFVSIEEQNEWMGKSGDKAYAPFVISLTAPKSCEGKVKCNHGGITLDQAGYLDTVSYLDAVRAFLAGRAAFQRGYFEPDKLEVHQNHVLYAGLRAKKIIFCQGVQNDLNPWFRHLPVKSLKGEFLTVQCDVENDVILNRGVYMVPGTAANEWRVGSTYNRHDQGPGITTEAREELKRKLEDLITLPYVITGQRWGVRPTTPDRKPILGGHPQYESLVIFNGFGTKGVSLAPYFSEVLFRWMENKGTIHGEADITRFY